MEGAKRVKVSRFDVPPEEVTVQKQIEVNNLFADETFLTHTLIHAPYKDRLQKALLRNFDYLRRYTLLHHSYLLFIKITRFLSYISGKILT